MNLKLAKNHRKPIFASENGIILWSIDNENTNRIWEINASFESISIIFSFQLCRLVHVCIFFLIFIRKDDIRVCVKYRKYIETHWFALYFVSFEILFIK